MEVWVVSILKEGYETTAVFSTFSKAQEWTVRQYKRLYDVYGKTLKWPPLSDIGEDFVWHCGVRDFAYVEKVTLDDNADIFI